MEHTAKAVLRQAKNYTKGYTDIQVKVREATSNDPWGPSGVQMQELADASYNGRDFAEIMDILDKRLNDSGKNWRHVFKALAVLDYLIHSGSEQVVAYAKQNLYVIKTLKEFQFIDEEGKDQKSKQIASLLADDDRLKDERKQRTMLRDRMAGASSFTGAGSDGFRPTPSAASRIAPSTAYEEQSQLERAIEESKRAAAEQERRMRERETEDRELQKALEISRRDQRQQQPQQQPQVQQTQQLDLWGSQDQKKNDLDFFASMAAPQPVAQTQPDPFGFQPAAPQQQAFFQQQTQQSFAAFSSNDQGAFGQQPFGQQAQPFGQQPFIQQQQQQPFGGNAFSQPPVQQQQAAFGNAGFGNMAQPAGSNSFASQPTQAQGGFGFDAAFDTGAGQKNFVPRSVQGQANPNAQLAQIARNAVQIDPFASMASSNPVPLNKASTGLSNTDLNWGGPTLQPTSTSIQPASNSVFGGAAASFGQPAQQPKSNSSDPFASLVPFSSKAPQQAPSLASQGSNVSMGQPMMSRQASGNPFGQQQQQPFGQQQQPFGQPSGFGGQSQQFGQQQQRPPMQQQNFFF